MDYYSSMMVDNGIMSIQEMISLDCDVKVESDDALDSLMDGSYPEKLNQSDLDRIFSDDGFPETFNNNSLDCAPLDMSMYSAQDLDTMKWLNDGDVSDINDIVTINHIDSENTNPNLMITVNPETVLPQSIYVHQPSGIATPPLTPSTPTLTPKMEFPTSGSPFHQSNSVQFTKVPNPSSPLPNRANNTTPLRCQQMNQFNSPSSHRLNGSKPPSPAVRALYREINNPSRNNPILLEQLQNPVQTAIKAAQNIAALNHSYSNTNSNNNSNNTKNNWSYSVKNNNQRNSGCIDSRVYQKPVFSYSCLIAMALKNSKSGSLPVSEIYNFMITHFPYFKTAPGGWKNSVRHNLSLNKCFEKVENPNIAANAKKGCLWGLNPAKIAKMAEEITKWRKKDPESVHNSMSDPDKIDLIEQGKAGSPPPLTDNHTTKLILPCTPPRVHTPPNNPSTPRTIHIHNPTTPHLYKPTTPLIIPRSCKDEVMDINYGDVSTGLGEGLNIDPVLSELSAHWDEDITSELTLHTPSSPLCHSPLNRTFNCITTSSYLHSSPTPNFCNFDITPTKQFHPQTPSRTISAL